MIVNIITIKTKFYIKMILMSNFCPLNNRPRIKPKVLLFVFMQSSCFNYGFNQLANRLTARNAVRRFVFVICSQNSKFQLKFSPYDWFSFNCPPPHVDCRPRLTNKPLIPFKVMGNIVLETLMMGKSVLYASVLYNFSSKIFLSKIFI